MNQRTTSAPPSAPAATQAVATARTGTARTGTARTGTARTGTARTGTARTGTARTGTARTGTARTGTARTGTATAMAGTGTARTGTARTGTARTGTAMATAETGTAETGTARTGTATATAATATERRGTSSAAPSVSDLAGAAKADRNRAVDAYRAVAMLAVAFGHWLVIAIGTDADGELVARNALEVAPELSWLTWIFQVMPLFFVVGGFASAMSLDAHWRRDGRDRDWVIARLRRMVAPTVGLAATWLVLLGIGAAAGAGGIVAAGAVGAAIPLWFLANYTIDTAFAPTVFRALRANRTRTVSLLLGAFAAIEAAHIAGVAMVDHLNWVLGWMLFQVGGFMWRDGLLPVGRRMLGWAGALWVTAIGLVAFGPWPVTMIHVSGVPFSPTHPPSLALVVFGAAFSATAIALAPAVTAFLTRNKAAWRAVVAGNAVSMSVYLWHFTAMVAASAVFYAVGWLPTAQIGSADWWFQKLPLVALAFVLLVPIVAVVSKVEQRALLAPQVRWNGSALSVFGLAALTSASLKLWSIGNIGGATVGMVGLVIVGAVLRPVPRSAATSGSAPS